MNSVIENVLKLLALLRSGIFAGAAFYITTVEHPARMSLGGAPALQEFRLGYKSAAPQQDALAIVSFVCSAALALFTHQWIWLVGGSLVGAVVPVTLIFIVSTNRLLLDERNQHDAHTLEPLLAKWARLHAVRTALSALGFLGLLWACVLQS